MRLLANEDMHMADLLEERLREEAPDVALTWVDKTGVPQGPVADATILYRFNMSNQALITILKAAPSLQWMHTGSAGVDTFIADVRENGPPGLILTNASGAMSPAIAEFCLAQIFAAAKQIPAFVRAADRHDWLRTSARPPITMVRGSRLLILGLGSIGLELARIANGVGMRVWGTRRTPLAVGETYPFIEQIFTGEENWRSVLPAMDYIAVCLPLTEATRMIISTPEFGAMKPTAWLINTSRGANIDEDALLAALRMKRIGGASLDVATAEPLPPDNPLWDFPNMIITPHVSWSSPEHDQRNLDVFFTNLHRFQAGEPLLNVVPLDVGY